eukprot:768283-Hanusia_phi.AAC.7
MLSCTSSSSRVSRPWPAGVSPKISEASDRAFLADVDNVIQAEYDFYASRKGGVQPGTKVTCIAGERRGHNAESQNTSPPSLFVSSALPAFQRSPHAQPSPLTKFQDPRV